MAPMAKTLGGFRAAVWVGWIALCVAGLGYARIRGIPNWAALPALAAFLVVYPFYLVPAFPSLRERFAGVRLPVFLLASFLLPYLAACAGSTPFAWPALGKLAALAFALGLWYFALPESPATDLGFGAMLTWILLGRYFDGIYPDPYPHVELAYVGRLAVLQAAVMVLMVVRRVPETGYGFLPRWKDWRIGAVNFLFFIAIGLPLALFLKEAQLKSPAPLWVVAGTFLGMLWVVTLFEEFVFRGVLQELCERWTGNRTAALLLTSAAFGLVHLPYRGFPHWHWVMIAAVLGFFCGRARNQAGDIRAAMVTHALVVTAFRGFFA
jgi:uncharacterized protein